MRKPLAKACRCRSGLNGLILEQLETIPQPGTKLTVAELPIEILETSDQVVKSVRLRFGAKRTGLSGSEAAA